MLVGAPITIEELLKVDHFAIVALLRPKSNSVVYVDLRADLRCLRKISTYAQSSVSVRSGEIKDIRALGWCPGPVGLAL